MTQSNFPINDGKQDRDGREVHLLGKGHSKLVINEQRYNVNVQPPVSFLKKVVSFLTLLAILFGFWLAGQTTIGIPDEVIFQVLTFFLYKWFVDNGYQPPKWFQNLFKK